jgi:hypothetical protein
MYDRGRVSGTFKMYGMKNGIITLNGVVNTTDTLTATFSASGFTIS